MSDMTSSKPTIGLSLPVDSDVPSIRWSNVLVDYVELTKPRIVLMIVLTTWVAMFVVPAVNLDGTRVFFALVGTGLVAASASVLNQWMERDLDALMQRTVHRPLPAGRLTAFEVAFYGMILLVSGILLLLFGTNIQATLTAFLTWALYLGVYTPMKTRSWWNTAVGTLPGALPVWIGWTAAGGSLWDLQAWWLLLVVVVWQFPHFMAIAWMYRDQYAQAGFHMITSADPSGRLAGYHAVIGAAVLVPLSVAAVAPQSWSSAVIAILALLLCTGQLIMAIRFFRQTTDASARRLLRSSLLYLPGILTLLLVRVWMD